MELLPLAVRTREQHLELGREILGPATPPVNAPFTRVTAVKIISKISNTGVRGSGYPQTVDPLSGPGKAKIPPLWDILNLLFMSRVYFCHCCGPSLPISGCSWGVLDK